MDKPFAAPTELPCEPRTELVTLRCTFCHGGLARAGAVFCAGCLAPHHADCRSEHGACAAPGCGESLTLTPRPTARPTRRWRRAAVFALVCAGLVVGVQGQRAIDPEQAGPAHQVVQPGVDPLPVGAPETTLNPSSVGVSETAPTEVAGVTCVEFAAGGYTHPLSLSAGQLVILYVDEEGYTNVEFCPLPGGDSSAPGTSVLVAERGQTVELRASTGVWPLAPTREEPLGVTVTSGNPPQIEVLPLSRESGYSSPSQRESSAR